MSALRLMLIGPLPRARVPIGGTQVSFVELARRFSASGTFEARVIDTSREIHARGRVRRALTDLRVLLFVLGSILFRTRRCEVVLWCASANAVVRAGPLMVLAARLAGRPLAISLFGGSFDLKYDRSGACLRWLVRRTVLRSPLVFLQTRGLIRRFADVPGACWHPTTRDVPARGSAASQSCRRFLYLGQLSREKGLVDALEASDRLPDGCTLAVYGTAPNEGGAPVLRGYARATLGGAVAPEDVPALLGRHDALVFPSCYEGEGMPGVVLEALQCGLPVVATRWRSIGELVEHERSGLLVTPRSVDELSAAMNRLASDAELFRRLQNGARERGEEFRPSFWHARLEARLERIVRSRARARSAPRRAAVAWLDRRLYPGVDGHWDDALLRDEIVSVLRPEHRLLDLGAGAGILPEMCFKGEAASVCGLDPDPRVALNPHLDEARIGRGEAIPWPAESFDVVVADNVLEHLDRPERVLCEVARVLRPGGVFVAKTPNRRHYVPLFARATPHSFHRLVNRWRGRKDADTFATRYRANTPEEIAALAARAGLRVRGIRLVEGRPEYLRLNPLTYLAGWAWERAVNAFHALERFRVVLLVVLEKPSSEEAA